MYAVGIGMLIVAAARRRGRAGPRRLGGRGTAGEPECRRDVCPSSRGQPSAAAYLPLYDIYQNFLVTPAWFISIVDEVRGARMRW